MKKILLIPCLLIAISDFAQVRTFLGPKGILMYDTTKYLNIGGDYLSAPNDSSMIFDSSKVVTDVTKINDSTIRVFKGGVAVVPDLEINGNGADGGGGGGGWLTNGNNSIAGSDFLGTNNNVSLRMRTNGIEGAVLDSNQRFGIGMTQPTSKLHVVTNGLAVTQTTSSGLLLENQTAATAGVPLQISPFLRYTGYAWNSTATASQPVLFTTDLLPQAGAAIAGSLITKSQINGGTLTTVMTLGSSGSLTIPGVFTSSATSGQNQFSSNLYLDNTTTGRFIGFNGNGATIRAVIGHQNTTGDLMFRVNDATTMTGGTAAMIIKQAYGNVDINTTTTSNDAIFNVTSTGKGVLFPRMTTAQRDAINLTVTSVTVTDGGTGYTTNPTVSFTDPGFGGIRAIAGSVTRVGNVITAIAVATAGSYNTTPVVTITGGGGSGATATAVMTQVASNGLVIYNTTTDKLQVRAGGTWVDLH